MRLIWIRLGHGQRWSGFVLIAKVCHIMVIVVSLWEREAVLDYFHLKKHRTEPCIAKDLETSGEVRSCHW